MIQKVCTYTNLGLQGFEIFVEADSSNSLPAIDIIGLPDAAIKESKERLRATFRNVGISLPARKFVLNLAPSDIKKVGTSFDLAMAMALLSLVYEGKLFHADRFDQFLFFGELGLDGQVKRVNGLLPSVISAKRHGYQHFFVPVDNIYELQYIPDVFLYPVANFAQLVEYFVSGVQLVPLEITSSLEDLYHQQPLGSVDFSHVKGHLFAKKALALAAAGLHNVLMIGSPGSGKTLLSKALQSILPPLGFEEIMEVSQIYSVVGKLSKDLPLIVHRPFRQVHHTASKFSIVGGGSALMPGEVSLAHKGILFFDELPEFPREVLEVLRQPLEDRVISISRVSGTVQYPAQFMFVAAMNPCACGYYKDPQKACSCSLHDIKRYQNKISGPLLDRIDLLLEIPRTSVDTLLDSGTSSGMSSLDLQERVLRAWRIQQQRYAGLPLLANSQLTSQYIADFIPLDSQGKDFLAQIAQTFSLSPRVLHRLMKLARTLADFEEEDAVRVEHLAEAFQYRNKSLFVEEN